MKTQVYEVILLSKENPEYNHSFMDIDKGIKKLEEVLNDLGYTEQIKHFRTQTEVNGIEVEQMGIQNKVFVNSEGLPAFAELRGTRITKSYETHASLILTYSNREILSEVIPTFKKYRLSNEEIHITDICNSKIMKI